MCPGANDLQQFIINFKTSKPTFFSKCCDLRSVLPRTLFYSENHFKKLKILPLTVHFPQNSIRQENIYIYLFTVYLSDIIKMFLSFSISLSVISLPHIKMRNNFHNNSSYLPVFNNFCLKHFVHRLKPELNCTVCDSCELDLYRQPCHWFLGRGRGMSSVYAAISSPVTRHLCFFFTGTFSSATYTPTFTHQSKKDEWKAMWLGWVELLIKSSEEHCGCRPTSPWRSHTIPVVSVTVAALVVYSVKAMFTSYTGLHTSIHMVVIWRLLMLILHDSPN